MKGRPRAALATSNSAIAVPVMRWQSLQWHVNILTGVPTMLAVLVLFRVFIFSASARGRFRRWYGIPLVLLYVAYVVVQYAIS